MRETIATYTLQITGDSTFAPDRTKRVLADLPSMIEETEENITDMLPRGFEARILPWDAKEGEVIMEIDIYDDTLHPEETTALYDRMRKLDEQIRADDEQEPERSVWSKLWAGRGQDG